MKKVKIAHFVTRLEFGGVESVILNYSQGMNGGLYDLHVVSQDIVIDGCRKQFEDCGFTVNIVTHKKKSVLKYLKDNLELIKHERFDIVHCHMSLTNFPVLFIAWFYGCKVRICHSHNSFRESSLLKSFVNKVLCLINKACATDYFACGHDAASFMFGNTAKVYILNNAIDLNKYAFNVQYRNEIRSSLCIDNKFCIGHIGRFSSQKNQSFLVDIAKVLRTTRTDFIFMLIGSGDDFDKIKHLVECEGLNEFFIFVGNTSEPYKYYQAMDVFVLPSLFEGLPVVGIEAQISGLKCFLSQNIDKRVKLTDSLEFLPITSVEIWEKRILETFFKYDRNISMECFVDAGYDIKTERQKLQNFYQTAVNNRY